MEKPIKTFFQLIDSLNTNAACEQYLTKLRWPQRVICPHCSYFIIYPLQKGYKCRNCQKKFNVLTNTPMENSKIGLRQWFMAIYFLTSNKKGISSYELARKLDIKQHTAWFMLHRVRNSLKEVVIEDLSGVVCVDETYVGGKNKNRHKNKKVANSQGRSVKDKTPVFGLVEEKGKARMFVVPDTESVTLHTLIYYMRMLHWMQF